MEHWWGRVSLAMATAALAACGSDGPARPNPVPAADGPAVFGCLDDAGTLSATAAQWYLDEGGGSLQVTVYPADFAQAASAEPFFDDVERVMTTAFPDAGIHVGDLGQEAVSNGGCPASRWADLWDDRSRSYFVALRRPESRVALAPFLEGGSLDATADDVIVGSVDRATAVLVVADDGTTLSIKVYGEALPGRDALVAAARQILDLALTARDTPA